MRRLSQRLRQRVAYHEAGYAVISYTLSVPLKFVTIRPEEENAAIAMRFEGQPVSDTFDENRAIIAFAGLLAEVEFCGRDSNPLSGWHDDLSFIRTSLRARLDVIYMDGNFGTNDNYYDNDYFENAYRSLRTKTERDALALVRKHKTAIKCVAQALLKYETLTSEQVRRLLQTASDEKLNPD
jgi:ATP-dependent Zn protease